MQRELIQLIKKAILNTGFISEEEITRFQIDLEVPKCKAYGDLSCSIAFKLSKVIEKTPGELSQIISDSLSKLINVSTLKEKIHRVEACSGFVNFSFTKTSLRDVLISILKLKDEYGSHNEEDKKRIILEFVSANPTGPLSIAHARQAVVGDCLANILRFCNYKPYLEYFINDKGRQIDLLGESIKVRYLNLLKQDSKFPEDGYRGKYISEIAKSIFSKYKNAWKDASTDKFSKFGMEKILRIIRKDLKDFGVDFDNWVSQAKLEKGKKIEEVISILRKTNLVYTKDGADWFEAKKFGDEKDRVVIKKDGQLTYLTPDIAYHKFKFERGYNWIVNIWGPDHHGYIPRIKAAVKALGFEKERIDILIVQLTSLYRRDKPIAMSTREGRFVTLREVMDEIGKCALRYFLLMRKKESHLSFDLDRAKMQSLENPVYYLQYAHARISSILEFAKNLDKNLDSFLFEKLNLDEIDLNLLDSKEEFDIIKTLREFPDFVRLCIRTLDPYSLTFYLEKLSKLFHNFYSSLRVVTDKFELTKARLVLILCVKIVLCNGLNLLGIEAPEKM